MISYWPALDSYPLWTCKAVERFTLFLITSTETKLVCPFRTRRTVCAEMKCKSEHEDGEAALIGAHKQSAREAEVHAGEGLELAEQTLVLLENLRLKKNVRRKLKRFYPFCLYYPTLTNPDQP